ncbi:MAG: carbohydrate kinase family protein [Streptosporangiales bacterium]|nr:carbohydrate kinase family protein [Streptosporangiales bacterium]
MQIAVTGSIATDHLMQFSGRFADSLVVDQLDKISLSFLVDDLEVRRGGVAGNIAFGMGSLGLRPLLVGAVGQDFGEYRAWLDEHGVDTSAVRVSETRHTARFVCTTDRDTAQIATFYSGAMSEAREIELAPLAGRQGGLDLVVIGANDPDGMLRHTAECRDHGYPFLADCSQQLAFMERDGIRALIDGARYLFTNEYEAGLTEQKTEWSAAEILDRVGTRVTTLGADGARIESKDAPTVHVKAVPVREISEPTGAGDGFRAGFLAGLAWELDHVRCAQLGSVLAAYVLEVDGPQEYGFEKKAFLQRFTDVFGADAAADVEPHLLGAGA